MTQRFLSFLAATDFTWKDAIDILIVAFVIYELLLFIRGTYAVQMALGAFVLVVLYWSSKWADLVTVNWLMRTFMPYVVFGIIVVFHTEIRKVLAHLGKTPLPWAFPSTRAAEVIDEVVLAATTLAAQRTGAIIVIEREMGLRSYVETGIALDAIVTVCGTGIPSSTASASTFDLSLAIRSASVEGSGSTQPAGRSCRFSAISVVAISVTGRSNPTCRRETIFAMARANASPSWPGAG